MHPLLKRQVARLLDEPNQSTAGFDAFFEAVSTAYEAYDRERLMLERSLEMSSTELLQTNAEMRAVLQAFPDVFLWIDTKNQVIDVQGNIDADIGVPINRLRDLSIDNVPDGALRASLLSGIEEVRSGASLARFEYSLEGWRADEKFEVRILPLVEDSVLAVVRDISEAARKEHMLRTALEAGEAATQAKDQFLATMSHEIRTPMNAVIGLTDLLLATSLDEDQSSYAVTIQSSGQALMEIINDILDYSKIEGGFLEIENIPFDPHGLLHELIGMVAGGSCTPDRDLILSIDESVPARTIGDPAKIRQVVLNLLSNAIKFTSTGQIAVHVSIEDFGPESDGLRVVVSDTGIGMDREALGRVFQPFTQADSSTTRRFGGTGLGLAICGRIIESLGGTIQVESEPGTGSVFSFVIPVGIPPESEPDQVAVIPTGWNGMRTLVVDDNETCRELLCQLLARWGFQPFGVQDHSEAWSAIAGAHAAGHPYQLFLVDEHLPGVSGLDLVRALAADPNHARTPRVLLHASPPGQSHDLSASGSIHARTPKPVLEPGLRNAVATAIRAVRESSIKPPATTPLAALAPEEPEAGHRYSVLVAEDNLVNQKVVRQQLLRLGYSVTVASNGREALEAVQKATYDIILMDCQMPDMDGVEATREIRAREKSRQKPPTPIVALTANALPGDEQRCLEAGMSAFLTKPLRMAELGRTVESMLNSAQDPRQAG